MGLVQSKQGSSAAIGAGGTLTITLDNPTTAGNALIVVTAASAFTANPSIGSITLGGSAGNFAVRQTGATSGDAGIVEIWDDLNCAGGQTAVAITVTGGSGTPFCVTAAVYERDDLPASAAFDKGTGQAGAGGTSWTSGSTATTTQAAELFVGVVTNFTGSAPTMTGPSSPWVNLTQVNTTAVGGNVSFLSGYEVVAATQTAAYAGSASSSGGNAAAVATFKLGAPAITGGRSRLVPQAVRRSALW